MQERKKLDDLIHLIGGGKLESELRELHVLPQKEAQAGDDTERALGEGVNGKLVSLHMRMVPSGSTTSISSTQSRMDP